MAKKILTHYDLLGVARNAPEEVIRGAWKALAQKNHPDKNLGNPDSTNIMQAINQAYAVLSDPAKKADYDARLHQQEDAEEERFRHQRAAVEPAQYNHPTGTAMPTYQPQSNNAGAIVVVVMLIAALFVAGFAYISSHSLSTIPLFANATGISAPVLPAVRPKAVEAFVPNETTPRELAVCIFAAAKTYNVPPPLLLSLLSAEGGSVGEKTPALGRTYDLGLMQINSFWVPQLSKVWEVSPEIALRRIRYDACVNVGFGAWILQDTMAKTHDNLHDTIAFYYAAAHHMDPKFPPDEAYINKVVNLTKVYKAIQKPEDLIEQTTAPINK